MQATEINDLLEVEPVREYLKTHPVEFCRMVLREELRPGQARMMKSLQQNSGFHHYDTEFGGGKTFLASRAAVWWVYTGGIVLTLAPHWKMHEGILWREIREAFTKASKVVGGERRGNTAWIVSPTNYARAITLDQIRGMSGRILIIIDEAFQFYDMNDPAAYDMNEYLKSRRDFRILELG